MLIASNEFTQDFEAESALQNFRKAERAFLRAAWSTGSVVGMALPEARMELRFEPGRLRSRMLLPVLCARLLTMPDNDCQAPHKQDHSLDISGPSSCNPEFPW